MNIVWVPWSCVWNEEETEVFLTEQAHDADLSMEDPKVYGPVRVQHYDAMTSELLDQKWTFNAIEWVTPTGTEEEAINAWIAWEPPPAP